MSKRRVVITGLGVISPLGNNAKVFWESLCNARSGIVKLTTFDVSSYNSQVAGEVKDIDPTTIISAKDLKRMDRYAILAVMAAHEAVADAQIETDKEDPYRIGVIVGSGIGGIGTIEKQHKVLLEKGPSRITPLFIPMLIVNMASGQVSILFGMKGPNMCIATACASGTHAIGESYRIILNDEADVMVAGGTEAALTPLGLGGFCAMRALSTRNGDPERASRPFDRERDGFVMAEGAGIVVLEELSHARRRNAPIYCEVAGYGLTGDAHHITSPSPDGDSITRCMQMAMQSAGLAPEEVDYINAHGTSTLLNDKFETLAIKKVLGEHAYKVPISSIKSMTGHLLGAAGGVETLSCALSLRDGIIPPTINYEFPDPECDLDYVPNTAREVPIKNALSNSLGFGGHNTTLAFKKFTQ